MALTKINLGNMVTGTLPDANIPNDITIDVSSAVPASGLTGSTLASGVTASSLTSVGDLTALTVVGNITMDKDGQAILKVESNDDASELRLRSFYDGSARQWSIFSNNTADELMISDGTTRFQLDSTGATFAGNVTVSDRVIGSGDLILVTTDSNEKIHMDSDGYIKFETAGTEKLRITGTGDIWHNNGNTVEHALAGHTNELNISHHWNSGQATIHFCYRMENTYTDFTFYNGSGSGHPDLNAASFDTTSDYRMKKSVANFTDNVCDKIKLLRPITYNWKANTKMNEAKQIGFLAHELQEQLPLAVKGEKDAMSEKDDTLIAPQSIKGEALSSYMMKALQEIITRLEALENA